MNRCGSANDDPSIRYHDEEWGVPVHDDRRWLSSWYSRVLRRV
jgi:DNA-3-methyladenine glycosylase I